MEVDETRLQSHLREVLRERRIELGLRQDEVAALTGLGRTTISNVEYGRQRVPLHVLYLICAALNLEVARVLPPVNKVVRGGEEPRVAVEGVDVLLAPKARELLESLRRGGVPADDALDPTLHPNAATLLRALHEESHDAQANQQEDRDGS